MYVCKPNFPTWPNHRTFNLQLQGDFNSAWQLAQTSGVKGSMNLTSIQCCKLVPTHLESAAKFLDHSQKGDRGFWPEHACTLADPACPFVLCLISLWK